MAAVGKVPEEEDEEEEEEKSRRRWKRRRQGRGEVRKKKNDVNLVSNISV